MKATSFIIVIFSICNLTAQTVNDFLDIKVLPDNNIHQMEVSCIINRMFPASILGSSIHFPFDLNNNLTNLYFYSNNGGATFYGNSVLPNNALNKLDPVAFCDANGRSFIGNLLDNVPSTGPPADNLGLIWSDNQCVTWATQNNMVCPTNQTYFVDKDWMYADTYRESPYRNNIYVAWSKRNLVSGWPEQVRYNRSTNGGTSFSIPVTLKSHPGQGTTIATGVNGEVYIAWTLVDVSLAGNGKGKELWMARSMDGGVTFTTAKVCTYNGFRTGTTGSNSLFNDTEVTDFPFIAVDRSCGTYRNRLYIIYPEKTSGNVNIKIKYSDDQGVIWSGGGNANTGIVVSTNTGAQNWSPFVAVDETTGAVCIVYYSYDNNTNYNTTTYMAYSLDGGSTFTTLPISDVTHKTEAMDPGFKSGHYISIDAYGGIAFAVWPDHRDENGDGLVNGNDKWQLYGSKVDLNVPINFQNNRTDENLVINGPLTYNKPNISYNAGKGIVVNNNNTSYTIDVNGDITMIADDIIEFKDGFEVKQGGKLYAYNAPVNPCGNGNRMAGNVLQNNETDMRENIIETVYIYPNPTSDKLYCQLYSNVTSMATIQIFDISGKLIFQSLNGSEIIQGDNVLEWDVSNYPAGLYYYSIKGDKEIFTGKFVKF